MTKWVPVCIFAFLHIFLKTGSVIQILRVLQSRETLITRLHTLICILFRLLNQ